MLKKYKDRLNIPIDGMRDIILTTQIGLEIASGYSKIVFVNNIPYLDINKDAIYMDNIYIPQNQKWRENSAMIKCVEYRSRDCCAIQILKYKDNADSFFISPFNLKSDIIPVLISPLKRKKKEF